MIDQQRERERDIGRRTNTHKREREREIKSIQEFLFKKPLDFCIKHITSLCGIVTSTMESGKLRHQTRADWSIIDLRQVLYHT